MNIKRLTLNNFKCFSHTDISFSKITLLTGPNSSGKSSLMYGILAPLQTRNYPFYFSPNGKYVNMGDYNEMVFNHEKHKHIYIDMTVGGDNPEGDIKIATEWTASRNDQVPRLFRLETKSSISNLIVVTFPPKTVPVIIRVPA
jgi:predicted ATP-dependent endonuclease of OLD family